MHNNNFAVVFQAMLVRITVLLVLEMQHIERRTVSIDRLLYDFFSCLLLEPAKPPASHLP